jgi:hypothetical protein
MVEAAGIEAKEMLPVFACELWRGEKKPKFKQIPPHSRKTIQQTRNQPF